jgi:hypothetical protein
MNSSTKALDLENLATKLKCNQIYESTMKRKPYFHYKYKNVKGMSTYPEKAAYYENISCLSIFEMLFAKKCG